MAEQRNLFSSFLGRPLNYNLFIVIKQLFACKNVYGLSVISHIGIVIDYLISYRRMR